MLYFNIDIVYILFLKNCSYGKYVSLRLSVRQTIIEQFPIPNLSFMYVHNILATSKNPCGFQDSWLARLPMEPLLVLKRRLLKIYQYKFDLYRAKCKRIFMIVWVWFPHIYNAKTQKLKTRQINHKTNIVNIRLVKIPFSESWKSGTCLVRLSIRKRSCTLEV